MKMGRIIFVPGRAEGIAEGLAEGRAEGRIEGMEKGIAKGRIEGFFDALFSLVKKDLLSVKDAAEQANITFEEFTMRMEAWNDARGAN